MSRISRVLGATAAAAALAVAAVPGGAQAQDRVRWQVPMAFASTLTALGDTMPWVADQLRLVSGGSIDLQVAEPGTVIPALSIFENVSTGAVEAGYSWMGYEIGAGVDVELRKGMWDIVRDLRAGGTTIILTTHYIEEAEAMADRVAVINGGRILLVEEKAKLMQRMGQKRMTIELQCPVESIPASLAPYNLRRNGDGRTLEYAYDTAAQRTGITSLLRDLSAAGLVLRDVQTRQDSLEDIFVGLVRERA